MAFDVEGARKAGYTDAEIAAHLAQAQGYDLAGAKKSGYSDSEVIAHLSKAPTSAVNQIPGQAPGVKAPAATAAPVSNEPTTIADKAIGAGEAALTMGSGATLGTAGMVGGFFKGLAEEILSGKFGTPEANGIVERSMQQGAEALTYAPRTPSGQAQAEAVGNVMQQLVPVAPIAPGMAPIVTATRGAAPASVVARAGVQGVARDAANLVTAGTGGEAAAAGAAQGMAAASRVADLVKTGATTLPRRALEALRKEPDASPTPGTMGSAGAAGTDMAAQRRAAAESLPVPLRLTKGQATRDAAQLKFEVETAKNPEAGAPLRQRLVEQNDQLLRNFDAFIDATGAEAPTLRATGAAVDSALVKQAARDKAQVRTLYKAAENAGEMEAPVTLNNVVSHLVESAPESATAPLLNVARAKALQLGIAKEEGGQLVAQPVPLKTAELFRQSINRATDYEATNVRQATILKGLVDEQTAGLGGDLYRQARSARQRYAQNYEDRATVAKLLSTRKGTSDRAVALEDVLDHAVLKGSLDDVRNLRRVLQRGGDEGQQAWRELQGGTLGWIKDQATRNVATDSTGNRVVQPAGLDKAIRGLDVDGRLDFIFGKRGAQQLRDLNDLAQYVKTVPPEAGINTSNTAATLLAAFADVAFTGSTGTPVPITSVARLAVKQIRDVKLRRRISDALDEAQRKQAPGKKKPTVREPSARRDGETVH